MAYDLLGQRFGKLTVIQLLPDRSHKEKHWLCECDCGSKYVAKSSSLVHGLTTQCHKCAMAQVGVSNTKHGCEPRKLHEAYNNMLTRCYNSNYFLFRRYGGRGIKVCDDWRESYINFRDWALVNGWEPGLSLDRIDNNKDYCPENCTWSTVIEQANNRSNNRYLAYRGETDTMANWSRRTGIPYWELQRRLDKAGMSIEEALSMPYKEKRGKKSV